MKGSTFISVRFSKQISKSDIYIFKSHYQKNPTLTADGWQYCCVCRTKQSFLCGLNKMDTVPAGLICSWLVTFLFIHNVGMMAWKCHILTKHFTWKRQTLTCFFQVPLKQTVHWASGYVAAGHRYKYRNGKKSQLSTTISRCGITNWTQANILLLCVCGFESILIVFAVLGKPKYSHMYIILLELVFS